MKRIIVPSLTAVLLLAISATAAAAGEKSGGVVPVGATSVPEPVPATGIPATSPTPATTSPAPATTSETAVTTPELSKAEAKLKAIRERAAKMPAAERDEIEKKLTENAKNVDVEAVTNGDATVAERFATEFGIPSEALLAERTQQNVGWGEVMIAHTLEANALGTRVDQLYTLRTEGFGWGQIAYGLGLRAGSLAAAVQTESLVARGTVKADGKVARIGLNQRVASAGGTHSKSRKARETNSSKSTTPESNTTPPATAGNTGDGTAVK